MSKKIPPEIRLNDDVILSAHIPKAGGMTLFPVFKQAYGSGFVADYPDRDPWAGRTDPVTLIHGHFELKDYLDSAPHRQSKSVSVVIVNYNAGRFLTECIRAALPQAGEVLVVDNASTDFSVGLCSKQFADDPKLKIIRNNTNMGFAAACNIGSKQTEGGYVLFLNPDCNLDARVVDELVRVLEADNSVGMVGGLLINPDGSEQGGGRRAVPTPWRSLVRAFGLSRFANRWPRLFFDFYLHRQPLPDNPIEVEAISGACMLVKREVMEDVGLWDEGYFLHCEDLDWCMRFRQKGWKIMFVPSARVTHALGACSRSRPVFVEWHKHKGMMRFYRKFFRHQYPWALMELVAIGVWIRFGCVACYYSVKRTVRTVGLGRG